MKAPRLNVLITGSAGVIGTVLTRGLPHDIRECDLPEQDARDQDALFRASAGVDAIVHLAWNARGENFRNGRISSENLQMTLAVLNAARAHGVGRVVLASSVHADTFWPPSGRLLDPHREPVPDSPYGASKVWIEAYGRHVAAASAVEVVAIRFGGVNAGDVAPDDPSELAVWLPHNDCINAAHASLTCPLPSSRYALVVAVGDNATRVHAFSSDIEWRPTKRHERPGPPDMDRA